MANITLAYSTSVDTQKEPVFIRSNMANRHGLIAGATGTGKTVSLKVLAEQFAELGVPVFMADVKGDLSGLAHAGEMSEKLQQRLIQLKLPTPTFTGYRCVFWDVFGQQGHPMRTTISEMGPLILGQLLNLNYTQAGVLTVAFRVADDEGLLLLDLKDLRQMLQFVSDNANELRTRYGNISAASVGAIQRQLLTLEDQGAHQFFGEPALNLDDLIQTDENGRGVINILAADKLMLSPKLYSCLLLWLISEFYETLPEVGDMDKPKMVIFFDEAHLLFEDANDALSQKIEQVVRLIRSKGIGIYFISQSPTDIPDSILGQLGHRIQHALRAFTPKDQKAIRAAALTFRPNPNVDVESALTTLGVGEALVSVLDESGTPTPVERVWMLSPNSQFAPLSAGERLDVVNASVLSGVYDQPIDRESAYEMLNKRAQNAMIEKEQQAQQEIERRQADQAIKEQATLDAKAAAAAIKEQQQQERDKEKLKQRIIGTVATTVARQVAGPSGSRLMRGILGSLFK
ncbi:helicase HerA-like domain-containing protein [Psychrobacter sp.]|uniref:helicase HerA-like domain-containing protein n=1 Tax=Psychrobacter sp. TaxID=56811 RepID=UPI0025E3D8F7|nr:helicase HerA-like domain-containing protein [Psychrobacter sp.]